MEGISDPEIKETAALERDDEDDQEEGLEGDDGWEEYLEDESLWYAAGKERGLATDDARLLYYDPATGLVLDRQAHAEVWRHSVEGLTDEQISPDFNLESWWWREELALSALQTDETPPPRGMAGQYGRLGCVLDNLSAGREDATAWVALRPYTEDGLEALVRELEATGSVLFRRQANQVYYENFATDFLYVDQDDFFQDAYEDGEDNGGVSTEEEALAWGREHAKRLQAAEAGEFAQEASPEGASRGD